jgi:cytochrome b561
MQRYTSVAIALHWMIAAAIILQLASGLWMGDAVRDPATRELAYNVFQWHKALGLAVLVLSLVRLGWRLTHTPPALPEAMARWEQKAAKAAHFLLYVAMIVIPFSGWILVSTSSKGLPTMFFNLFEWPHLPVPGDRKMMHGVAEEVHELVAYALIALLAAHILAALKHQFINRDNVLWHMLPIGKPRGDA